MTTPPVTITENKARRVASGHFWDGLSQWLVIAALLLVAVSFKHYGITWDEPLHLENGWRALDWYLSMGKDQSVLTFQNLYLYGALYDVLVSLAGIALPFDIYESRRLIGGLIGVLGLIAVHRQARALGGPRAGALAVLLLLLTPEWMGQAFANPKDIPFATAAAWAGLAQIRLLRELPRPSAGAMFGYGLAVGCALGIRVGGVILFMPLAIGALVWLYQRCRLEGVSDGGRQGLGAAVRLLPAFLLAWMVMIAAWPWAQMAPFTRPFEALASFSHFPLRFSFLFAGQTLVTTDLPWWYVPTAFAVKLPEVTLLGLAAALVLGGRALIREKSAALTPERTGLAAFILLPPLVVIITGAVLYDGIRHLLFIMPMLTVAAALGLDKAVAVMEGRLQGRTRETKAALAGLLALWAGWQGSVMVRLHPYEAIWYNSLAGGVSGAKDRFELDYWGTALSEAASRLRDRIVTEEGSPALAWPYRVRICGPSESALYYLPPRWQAPPDGKGGADFYISFTRHACADAPAGKELLRVERMGATLAYVLDLRATRDRVAP